MTAAIIHLPPIEKGATYKHTFQWQTSTGEAINIAGCTARLQVREKAEAATVLLDCQSTGLNPRLIITGNLGKIDLVVTDEDTTLLRGLGGVYDLNLTFPNGEITRLCKGKFAFEPGVTHV